MAASPESSPPPYDYHPVLAHQIPPNNFLVSEYYGWDPFDIVLDTPIVHDWVATAHATWSSLPSDVHMQRQMRAVIRLLTPRVGGVGPVGIDPALYETYRDHLLSTIDDLAVLMAKADAVVDMTVVVSDVPHPCASAAAISANFTVDEMPVAAELVARLVAPVPQSSSSSSLLGQHVSRPLRIKFGAFLKRCGSRK